MKKFRYKIDKPKGTLEFLIPDHVPDSQIEYECDCAYSAWLDTTEDDDFIDMPEYIAMCLSDAGITVVMFSFEED